MSRLDLLMWINEFTGCDYPRVEMLCDGIGYCQVLDAIHPNFVQLTRLNFSAKFQEDC
jgi:RP/EB family microtubule-associated protein